MSREKYSSEENKIIGARITSVREALCIKRKVAFAKQLNMSPGFIGDVENGVKMPGSKLLSSLKRIYGVNINWLITGIGEMFETSCDIKTISTQEKPYNESHVLTYIEKASKILSSEFDKTVTAFKESIDAFHLAVQCEVKVKRLEKEALKQDRHIKELERKVEALTKVANPTVPNTDVKEK